MKCRLKNKNLFFDISQSIMSIFRTIEYACHIILQAVIIRPIT